MINKRLIKEMQGATKQVYYLVFVQYLALLANIVIIYQLSRFIGALYEADATWQQFVFLVVTIFAMVFVRGITNRFAAQFAHKAAADVKVSLRTKIFRKLQELGVAVTKHLKTSEIIQLTGEGVEQLELYFAAYLPQFFYALLAPLTLFVVLLFIDVRTAFVLLICVPLIPVSIVIVMKAAKKILHKYWGMYLNLGDSFLDNLQGLTTLKIYNYDAAAHEQMNEDAEKFRDATMKVLLMQLNSIGVMDIVAYAGSALGIILALLAFTNGKITLAQGVMVILISAEFFIPMRTLGSVFHTAMNGASSATRMFAFLDIETNSTAKVSGEIKTQAIFEIQDVTFSYGERQTTPTLHDISMSFVPKTVTAIVGESGSGKSTIAQLLMGWQNAEKGEIMLDKTAIAEIEEASFYQHVHLIPTQSYLFAGSIRDNLLLGQKDATNDVLYAALDKVHLGDFVRQLPEQLDYQLTENGANLSGGQRQRLALARSLLYDSQIYIFDEATSSVDAETEDVIISILYELAKEKTIILISHRLANVTRAEHIYVLGQGECIMAGTHAELMQQNGWYQKAYKEQQAIENSNNTKVEEGKVC